MPCWKILGIIFNDSEKAEKMDDAIGWIEDAMGDLESAIENLEQTVSI